MRKIWLVGLASLTIGLLGGSLFLFSLPLYAQEKGIELGNCKAIIFLDKHKIHEDEYGTEYCFKYDVYLSEFPLDIRLIESNAKTKAHKKTPPGKFKSLMERDFSEWYFYEDLVKQFKKFPYHSLTNSKGIVIFSNLTPGRYYLGACGRSSGKTYGATHNVDFGWYCELKIQEGKTTIINLNFDNRKVTALDRNWSPYGGR